MTFAARSLVALAAISFFGGCHLVTRPKPVLAAGALTPSPRLIVGRILAVDTAEKFAFVELASDAPAAAVADGTELIARSLELRESARLRATRQLRGRTLGANILGGQPSPGDEVVWLAP